MLPPVTRAMAGFPAPEIGLVFSRLKLVPIRISILRPRVRIWRKAACTTAPSWLRMFVFQDGTPPDHTPTGIGIDAPGARMAPE